jgi:hypothetical protein
MIGELTTLSTHSIREVVTAGLQASILSRLKFASFNALRAFGFITTAHSGIPAMWLRGSFTAASLRCGTKTVHLGDGLDRI